MTPRAPFAIIAYALAMAVVLAFILWMVAGCAAAPGAFKTGNPNCIMHCVTDQVEAPGAKAPVTATQNGQTSATRS